MLPVSLENCIFKNLWYAVGNPLINPLKVNGFGNGPDESKLWYKNGRLHRTDGPAVEWPNGYKEWYLNGKLHKEDGPAREWPDGNKLEWWLNNKRHREDGPAIECKNGHKEWWLNGKLHREDGPAIENNDMQSWYLFGILIRTNQKKEV